MASAVHLSAGLVEFLGIRFIGINAKTGYKLLLSLAFVAAILMIRMTVLRMLTAFGRVDQSERTVFWGRRALRLGLMGAGLAFALGMR